jgi:Uncharacterized protein involved in copper resistance
MSIVEKRVEICVDSVESAVVAQSAGAYRVEFCDNLIEGGTTPSFGQLKIAREFLSIKLYVIIRPRGGNFLYSDIEFNVMKEDIRKCAEIGCDGIVIGILKADGSVDKERNAELVDIAKSYSMGVTFHRAFDRCRNLNIALEDVIATGCERILTSGGKNNVLAGASVIKKLIGSANDRITIMPGAGLTPENIREAAHLTGATEFHGTFRSLIKGNMEYLNRDMKDEDRENTTFRTDLGKVRIVLSTLNDS